MNEKKESVVDTLFDVAFRGGKRIAFLRSKRLADLRFGDFVEPVEIDDADSRLRGRAHGEK